MAPTSEAQPDHFLLQGLDKVFTGEGGNAPALAGWLSYLTHPEEHKGPRRMSMQAGFNDVEDSEKEFKEIPSALPQQDGIVFEDRGSILRDLSGEHFFAHAQVLSGQRLGDRNSAGEQEGDLVGEMYRVIESVRYREPKSAEGGAQDTVTVWHLIRERGNRLFYPDPTQTPGWTGDTANAARPKYDELTLWYEMYRDRALAEMMGHLGRFAAVIYTARQELNELMGELVKSLREWETSEPSDVSFALAVFGDIFGFALSPGLAAGATTFYGLVTKVIDEAKKGDNSVFGYQENPDDGCYKMLDSYLRAGDQVLARAVSAVNDLVGHEENGINAVRGGNWAPVPKWA